MRKKIVALMLGVVVALSVTACGGNDDKEKKADSSAAVEEEAPEAEDDSSAVDEADESADDSSSVDEADEPASDSSSEEETPDAAEEDGESQNVAEGEVSEDMWNLIEQLSLLEPTDALIGTEWSLSGGLIDGVEMDQAALDKSLELYSGKLDIVFDDDENISMVQGGATLKGTFGVSEADGRILGIVFDNNGSDLPYVALLAEVDGEQVLMLFSDDTGRNAVYFTQNQ